MASPPRRTIARNIRSSTLQCEEKYREFFDSCSANIGNNLTRTVPTYRNFALIVLYFLENFRFR